MTFAGKGAFKNYLWFSAECIQIINMLMGLGFANIQYANYPISNIANMLMHLDFGNSIVH